MIHIELNKELPTLLLEPLKKRDNGKDFTFAITADPIMLFIVLNNILLEEIEQMKKSLELGSLQIDGVPFLTLDYGKGLVFEFPILSLENENANLLNIILVDRDGYVVSSIRIVDMNKEVHSNLITNIKDIKGDVSKKLQIIYRMYSTEKICNHENNLIQHIGEI